MAKLPQSSLTLRSQSNRAQQLSIAFESDCMRGLSAAERTKALSILASLLILAAGDAQGEANDEQH